MIELASNFIAAAGVILAIVALVHSRRANREAREANNISLAANSLAEQANEHAARAVELQEDQGVLRLRVEPRIMRLLEDGEGEYPRPVVKVVNLSAFPVTISGIHWENNLKPNGQFWWKELTVAMPFEHLPARLPPRESLTAFGVPTTYGALDDLAAISAAVVSTACGQTVVGMTEDWKESLRYMIAERESESEVESASG